MWVLKIFTLGGLQFFINDKAVSLSRRKASAMLVYLAVTGAPQGRESLAAMFWPEAQRNRGLAGVRQSLLAIRKELRAGASILASDPLVCGLSESATVICDAIRLRAALASADACTHGISEICDQCLPGLIEAADLYRGDFLAGFHLSDAPEFEQWRLYQAEGLDMAAETVLSRLSRHYLNIGERETALDYARKQCRLDPLNEPAQRTVISLLDQLGKQKAALDHYERFAAILETDLGVTPEPETQRLAARIRTLRTVPAGPVRVSAAERLLIRFHNLPSYPTRFVGRDKEIRDITGLLGKPECRLLNIVGLGGMGKSRLAVRVAEMTAGTYTHGTVWVPLAGVASEDLIAPAIAAALNLAGFQNNPSMAQIRDFLSDKHLLLVLDNLEHLPKAETDITALLEGAPGIKILAASRHRLRCRRQWCYDIQGLKCGGGGNAGNTGQSPDAVRLFLHTARKIRPRYVPSGEDLDAIHAICREVGGMPLALEMAAGWLNLFPPRLIHRKLAHSMDLLHADERDRSMSHRSVRSLFDATWNHLPKGEQEALVRLSAFNGSFTAETAMAVTSAAPKALHALAHRSLIQRPVSDRLALHELLRQYVREKLGSMPDLQRETAARFQEYYTAFISEKTIDLKGGAQARALSEIEMELPNLRAVWQEAIQGRRFSILHRMWQGLALFYEMRAYFTEAKVLFEAAVKALSAAPADNRARMLLACLQVILGGFGRYLTHNKDLRPVIRCAARVLNDSNDPTALLAYIRLGSFYSWRPGCFDNARFWLEKATALSKDNGDLWMHAMALFVMGEAAQYAANDVKTARQYYEKSLVLRQEIGDRWGTGTALCALSMLAYYTGAYHDAANYAEQAREISSAVGDRNGRCWAVSELAGVEAALGRYDRAAALQKEGLSLAEKLGNPGIMAWRWYHLGKIAMAADDPGEAEKCWEKSLLLFEAGGHDHGRAAVQLQQGGLALVKGDFTAAERLARAGCAYFETSDSILGQSEAAFQFGSVLCETNRRAEGLALMVSAVEKAVSLNYHGLVCRHVAAIAVQLSGKGDPKLAAGLARFVLMHPAATFEARERAAALVAGKQGGGESRFKEQNQVVQALRRFGSPRTSLKYPILHKE